MEKPYPHNLKRFEILPTRITKLPDGLRELADDETVYARWPNSTDGATEGTISAGYCRELFEVAIKRQAEGFFTIREAAELIANTLLDADSKKIKSKILASNVPIRDPSDKLRKNDQDRTRDSFHLVKSSDIDKWLAAENAPYRFPIFEPTTPPAPPVVDVGVSDRVSFSAATLKALTRFGPNKPEPLPLPGTDWELWANMPKATLTEAVAVSLGLDPSAINPRSGYAEPGKDFERRLKLACAFVSHTGPLKSLDALPPNHLLYGPATATVSLPQFSEWALSMGWELPEKFPRLKTGPRTAVMTMPPAPPVVADSTPGGMNWTLVKPRRFPGYRKPLYDLLRTEHIAGKPCPTARDVLDAWRINPPPEVPEVMGDGFKYFNAKGNTQAADLEAIRKAIRRMSRQAS